MEYNKLFDIVSQVQVGSIEIKLDELKSFLRNSFVYFVEDYHLKYQTYFKTGGHVKCFIAPSSLKEMRKVIDFLYYEKIDYKLIGATSNILFFDEITYAVVVSTKNLGNCNIDHKNRIARIEAGFSLEAFVRVMLVEGYEGFEGLEGIPGTIGGGVFMNAGAYGYNISDQIISVECLDEKGNFVTLDKLDCGFKYRDSIFKSSSLIILAVNFALRKGEGSVISKKIETFHIARHSYQEFAYPNLGSMISLSGNLYAEILKRNKKLYYLYFVIKVLFKNPLVKFYKRKSPDSIPFNKLLKMYLKELSKEIESHPMSKKSANILINKNKLTGIDFLNYMYGLHDLVDSVYKIENEPVLKSIYKADEEFLLKAKELIR
ncbi:UDP-N-acetylmuramate dehydrogenase [Aureibacter tunicatorum]|uniref:UDP-N-acetylenolpyruvoylglucosamine reductase n=1 Tax=Aureibacter tunicatorum TaxID=866807 RepID=A0AAE3XNE0_9BACT|nr:FAD-binding protein [Aureibacter tunicatorum]MDR6240152.1 UDP-N-acetylmuramate dehydrogenase [Aureibacter tunicatorum]BDD05967.1 hypothetical protein AUTU_34500 [Aureibacter tunicatorum]